MKQCSAPLKRQAPHPEAAKPDPGLAGYVLSSVEILMVKKGCFAIYGADRYNSSGINIISWRKHEKTHGKKPGLV